MPNPIPEGYRSVNVILTVDDAARAIDFYKQAYNLKPKDLKYRSSYERTRFLSAASHVHRGQIFRDAGITAQHLWTISPTKVNELRFQYARRGLLYTYSPDAAGGNVAVNIPGFAFIGR